MTQMHGDTWFAGVIWCKWYTPPVWVCRTTEIEHPYRMCKRTLIIRFWWDQCGVFGKWKATDTEWYENLLMAVKKRKRLWWYEKKQAARNFGNIPEDREDLGYSSIQDSSEESSTAQYS